MRYAIRAALAAAALLALSGCGRGEEAAVRLLAPTEFAAALAEPDRVAIDVHVPDEGSIAGTELSIPYDQLDARRAELPDRETPLAVYCMSGRMSALAVQTLAELGYGDVVELEGGMLAWRAAGRRLLPPQTRQ